jgi:hypothetical protein
MVMLLTTACAQSEILPACTRLAHGLLTARTRLAPGSHPARTRLAHSDTNLEVSDYGPHLVRRATHHGRGMTTLPLRTEMHTQTGALGVLYWSARSWSSPRPLKPRG